MTEILSKIASPADLKGLSTDELRQVAAEVRQALVAHLAETGGHFASNLGAVDLIVALHAVYSVPRDKIVFDVGHQCYAHKMLTGRLDAFSTLRQFGGISGFLRRDESPYDVFGAGHASTSISAAFGFAAARDMVGGDESVVAVIGDAGLTGGLALEGLNNAGHSGRQFTVVLNDNQMSIAPNVGALSRSVARMRTSVWYQDLERITKAILKRLPAGDVAARAARGIVEMGITNMVAPDSIGVLFEQMGFEYLGPLDGHDIPAMVTVFNHVRQMNRPVLVHLMTVKGKGYEPAEENARKYHAVTPFEPHSGEALRSSDGPTYTGVFADAVARLAEQDSRVVAITAAMPDGTGLQKMQEKMPARVFDTGIAEQHAVCFAAGLAAAGQRPIVAIYSTFLQRAYDMIVHDVALQNLPVIFALDRAGLVGEDGGTHHGALDLSYLGSVPNMVVMAPRDGAELTEMMRFALQHTDTEQVSPVAIRYPRGRVPTLQWPGEPVPIQLGKSETLLDGKDVTLVAIGSMVAPAYEAAGMLRDRGILATVINARFLRPLDADAIVESAQRTGRLLVIEENARLGGLGSAVLGALSDRGITGIRTRLLGLPDRFVEHGNMNVLQHICGLTADDFATAAADLCGDCTAATPARG